MLKERGTHNYICPECGNDTRGTRIVNLVTTYAFDIKESKTVAIWWHKLCFRLRK